MMFCSSNPECGCEPQVAEFTDTAAAVVHTVRPPADIDQLRHSTHEQAVRYIPDLKSDCCLAHLQLHGIQIRELQLPGFLLLLRKKCACLPSF